MIMMAPVQAPVSDFNAQNVKKQFPAMLELVNGRPLTFLDSAASAQKPKAVMAAMQDVMQFHYANVHRGVYSFSQQTTQKFESARTTIARFLNAKSENEIIFTRNTTEAINLVAQSWGRQNLKKGDEIILSELEHHANIVPWHMLREEIGFKIRVVPVLPDGRLDMAVYDDLLCDKTKLVSVTHMSNAIGTIVPVKEMTVKAKNVGAIVIVDASQAVVHMDVDVQNIGCDFLAFTGHKLYGPTGVGVLYGREDLLNGMPPYQGGGEMIDTVSFDHVTYKQAPARFEAGTPPIIEAIGLGAAIEWLSQFDKAAVHAHENDLLQQASVALAQMDNVKIFGNTSEKASILSFSMDGIHPHDVGTILDQMGVAVRAGHHCAQPLMTAMGVSATVRASFAIYNTAQDVENFLAAVNKVQSIFG